MSMWGICENRLSVATGGLTKTSKNFLTIGRLCDILRLYILYPDLSDSSKSTIDRSAAMWQALSPKGVVPARESFLKQRKIPDKPE
jgi:hypothetical protein